MPTRLSRTFILVLALSLAAGFVGVLHPAEAAVVRPFSTRFSLNTTGAITMTGNTSLTCPTTAAGCVSARTGAASTLNANNNNNYSMVFVDIDADPTTFNSSRNTLSIASTATVRWAGLYWGADTTAGTNGSAATNQAARDRVLLRTPEGTGYVPIVADRVDTSPVAGGVRYQGFADVTSLVTAGRSGEYTVANVQAGRGNDRYGGWALVVVLQDPNEPLRNLTVFDGYAVVQQTPSSDQNVAIPVSGFLTPPSGAVRSRVGVVAYEGDLGLPGDSLRLNSTSLTNSLNPTTNFFNSSLTHFNTTNTTGDPFQTNLMGIDVDTINANGILANGASTATINLNTTNDTYFPGVVSFSTELFAPRLDLSKSGVDVNGGSLDVGDEVLYTVNVANNGDDAASSVILRDLVPDNSTYVPGSMRIDGQPITDAAADDRGELATAPARVVLRLGAGATSSAGGSLSIGATTTISFRVTMGTVPPGEALTNVATATYVASTSGLALEGSSNAVVLTPRSLSDLTLLKDGPRAPVTVPGTALFSLVVVNRGPEAEPSALLTDVLPAGFSAVSATSSQGSCSTGSSVTCTLGLIPPGETVTITIETTVSAGSGAVTNEASITGGNLDLFPNNNTASAVVMLNRSPSAVDHVAATPASTPISVAVLTGASDPDGDTLTTVSAGPAGKGVVVIGDGTVTYTPPTGFRGVDTFTYTITDGSATASATVTITVANAAPVAVDDSVGTLPATPVSMAVLANDFDINSDPISIASLTQPAGGAAVGTSTDNGDGTITFTPSASFRGTATFTYTITDGVDFATATVSVVVPDAAPVAVDDNARTAHNASVVISVLANDVDDNGDILTVFGFTGPANGSAVDNGDGTITYTPNVGFKGTDSFTYTITDGTTTASAVVTVFVDNAPPLAADDSGTTLLSTPLELDVLANDTDVNGDTLTISDVHSPAKGVATIGPGNTIIYTPDVGAKGIDTFVYSVTDGTDTSSALVTVTVPNRAPVAAIDHRTTPSGTTITIPVLENDFDANDDVLDVASVSIPAAGIATRNGDGTISYTPNPGFSGSDRFTYVVTDGTDVATGTVVVFVQNAPPIAIDDVATMTLGSSTVIGVLDNDSDANGHPLSLLLVNDPANGAVTMNADGTITYTPNAGFLGEDTFTYVMTDGFDTASARVTVTVTSVVTEPPIEIEAPPNVVPVATDDAASTTTGDAVRIDVLGNDTDLEGGPIRIVAVTQGSNGSVTVNPDGTVTYLPDAGFTGDDTFTYTITGDAGTSSATVTVTVLGESPNSGPLAFTGRGIGRLVLAAVTMLLLGSALNQRRTNPTVIPGPLPSEE